jgi:hypothetical protein
MITLELLFVVFWILCGVLGSCIVFTEMQLRHKTTLRNKMFFLESIVATVASVFGPILLLPAITSFKLQRFQIRKSLLVPFSSKSYDASLKFTNIIYRNRDNEV